MYNKAKRILELIAAIIGIVLGALVLLEGVIVIFDSSYTLVNYLMNIENVRLEQIWDVTEYYVGGMLKSAVGVFLLVFGIKLVKKPVIVDGQYKSHKRQDIVLIVFLGLCILFNVIFGSRFGWTTGIAAATIALKIVALCLKNGQPEAVVEESSEKEAPVEESDESKPL